MTVDRRRRWYSIQIITKRVVLYGFLGIGRGPARGDQNFRETRIMSK